MSPRRKAEGEVLFKQCPACGKGPVVVSRREGREAQYNSGTLKVPADILLPECVDCHEWLVGHYEAIDLDNAAREAGLIE